MQTISPWRESGFGWEPEPNTSRPTEHHKRPTSPAECLWAARVPHRGQRADVGHRGRRPNLPSYLPTGMRGGAVFHIRSISSDVSP